MFDGRSVVLWIVCVIVALMLPLGEAHSQSATRLPDALSGIVDRANVLTVSDRTELRHRLARIADRFQTDFFLVTIDDTQTPWREIAVHRYMVTRAREELAAVRNDVQAASRPLTVLIAFKRNPILHLISELSALDSALFVSRFYAGFEAAAFKVRTEADTHGTAALRYLELLDDKTRHMTRQQIAALEWLRFEHVVKWLSREIWHKLDRLVGLGQAWSSMTVAFSVWLLSVTMIPGFFALVLLGFAAAALQELFVQAGRAPVTLLGYVANLMLFAPILAALYTITAYDIENILFLAERFGLDFGMMLERARNAHSYDFEVGIGHLVAGVGLLILVEVSLLYRDPSQGYGLLVREAGLLLIAAAVLYFCPGTLAVCAFVYLLLRRIFKLIWSVRAERERGSAPVITQRLKDGRHA